MDKKTLGNGVKTVFINLAVLGVLLVILELFTGHWFRPVSINNLMILHGVRMRFDTSEIYASPTNSAYYTRDQYGLRGSYPSPDKIDILTIGGSTTDERYISDGLTFQDQLAERFRKDGRSISVVNAGIDGQSTHGHLKSFDTWFKFIPGLKPRFYLYYVGINDFYLPAGYGVKHGKEIEYDIYEGKYIGGLKEEIKNRSSLYNLLVVIRGMIWAMNANVYHGHDKPAGFKYVKITFPLPPLNEDEKTRLADYRSRLSQLFARTLEFTPSAKLICVTQGGIGLWKKDKDGTLWSKDPKEYPMRQAMNATLLDVCQQYSGIGIDLANEIPFEMDDFYDSIHNTPSGARRIADFLYSKLKDRL